MSAPAQLDAPTALNRRILRAVASVTAAGIAVKLAAMGKEIVVAALYGRSDAMDASLAAFLIPNLLINLIAESMNQALIPTLIRVRLLEGRARARQLLANSTLWLCLLLTAASALMALFARAFFPLIASNFAPAKLALSIHLFYALLPCVLLGGIASNCAAVLNSRDRYTLPALAPALVPIAIVAIASAFHQTLGIWALVFATVAGMALHAAVMTFAMRSHGYAFRLKIRRIEKHALWLGESRRGTASAVPASSTQMCSALAAEERSNLEMLCNKGTAGVPSPKGLGRGPEQPDIKDSGFSPCLADPSQNAPLSSRVTRRWIHLRRSHMDAPTREVARQFGPLLLSSVVASGGLLVDQAMAAMLPAGSVSALVFAGRFISIATALLAGSVSTAVTPAFSSLIARQDWPACRATLRDWTRRTALVSAPIAIALIVFARPLIRLTLQHGAFAARDTAVVAPVLAMYALQIPFFVVSRVSYRFIVAMRRTDLVFWCGLLNLVLDVILNLVLMRFMGIAGIALATSLWTVGTWAFLAFWSRRLLTRAAPA